MIAAFTLAAYGKGDVQLRNNDDRPDVECSESKGAEVDGLGARDTRARAQRRGKRGVHVHRVVDVHPGWQTEESRVDGDDERDRGTEVERNLRGERAETTPALLEKSRPWETLIGVTSNGTRSRRRQGYWAAPSGSDSRDRVAPNTFSRVPAW